MKVKVAAFQFDYNVNSYNLSLPALMKTFKEGDKLDGEVLARLLRFNPDHVKEVEVESKELPKVEPKAKLSKDDAMALNKSEQVALLLKLGLSEDKIKKLTKEADRVDKILSLQ